MSWNLLGVAVDRNAVPRYDAELGTSGGSYHSLQLVADSVSMDEDGYQYFYNLF